MRTVSAVVGSNFGDEGKGHVVDWLTDAYTLVVRFNGGAQAGHTVVTPDGRRHVFHHFGSGTLAGGRTFLSRFFLLNPMLFVDELKELVEMDVRPIVYADPRCEVTTPWDMLVNRGLENGRGDKRHGSCGAGVHETMVRAEKGISLRFADLARPDFGRKLEMVREYHKAKAKETGLPQEDLALIEAPGMLNHFADDCAKMFTWCRMEEWGSQNWRCPILDTAWNVVFEGAQGLRLDEGSKYFPHVTHSKTGVANVLTLMNEARMNHHPLEVYYVTRPYITRHGAGPLPHEVQRLPYTKFSDQTNVKNPYQGTLRFALFEKEEFLEFVRKDILLAKNLITPKLAVTCLDHLSGEVLWFDRGEMQRGEPGEWVRSLGWLIDARSAVLFEGPTRQSFYELPTSR